MGVLHTEASSGHVFPPPSLRPIPSKSKQKRLTPIMCFRGIECQTDSAPESAPPEQQWIHSGDLYESTSDVHWVPIQLNYQLVVRKHDVIKMEALFPDNKSLTHPQNVSTRRNG